MMLSSDTPSSEWPDAAVLEGCCKGNAAAREELVQRFSGLVYQCVRQVLTRHRIHFSPDDMADMHNSIFLSLLDQDCRKLRSYRGENGCSLATWIRTVAIRLSLNHLRRKGPDSLRERHLALPMDEEWQPGSPSPAAHDLLVEKERRLRYTEAVARLPEKDRLFLRLHIDEELGIQETARLMRITPQSAYTRKHRVLHKLRAYLIPGS